MMKIKKIVSIVLAAVISAGMCASTTFAVGDGEATYCFDNASLIGEFLPYGSVDETNTKITHTVNESKNGNGCIVISEDITEKVSQEYGGFYIEAETLGLDSFKGCVAEMSVKAFKGRESHSENISIFSDGIIYLAQPATTLSSEEWTTITLAIPEGAANSKLGFTIPSFALRSGDMVYIDDFTITTSDGSVIKNRGDYEIKKVSEKDAAPLFQRVLMIILLVILVLAIVGGIGFIISKSVKRFS